MVIKKKHLFPLYKDKELSTHVKMNGSKKITVNRTIFNNEKKHKRPDIKKKKRSYLIEKILVCLIIDNDCLDTWTPHYGSWLIRPLDHIGCTSKTGNHNLLFKVMVFIEPVSVDMFH